MPYNTRRHTLPRLPPPDALPQLTVPVTALTVAAAAPNVPDPTLLPPGVAIHPEDASSRVFTAIRASMASVSNRAMTVKDLAEHCLKHGLVCSGSAPVNAACQQITNFIRVHLKRCLDLKLKPLIKSLVLTGTPSDDKLAPGIYTQFTLGTSKSAYRKGSTVWYLSNVTGLPDPFEKCGVSPIQTSACRKRRRRRESIEEPVRPKIKLKLRLGPCPSSSSPTKPPATPATHPIKDFIPPQSSSPCSSRSSSPSPILALPPYPMQSRCHYLQGLPLSPMGCAEYSSPPPDSEDEENDFHNSMLTDLDFNYDTSFDIKPDVDSDAEEDSRSRSRSTSWATVTDPRTPKDTDIALSYPVIDSGASDDTAIDVDRTEPNSKYGVQGILERWEERQEKQRLVAVKTEMKSEWSDGWLSLDDNDDLTTLASPPPDNLLLKMEVEVKQEEGLDQSHEERPRYPSIHPEHSLLASPVLDVVVPRPTFPMPPKATNAWDGVELLGPDSLAVEELDNAFVCEMVKSGKSNSRSSLSGKAYLVRTIEGVELYELVVNNQTLRRRVDNSFVHLNPLLFLLSRTTLTQFLKLSGASYIRGGILQGTWMPLDFARGIITGRDIPSEVHEFLATEIHPLISVSSTSPRPSPSPAPVPSSPLQSGHAAPLSHSASLPLLHSLSENSPGSCPFPQARSRSLMLPRSHVKAAADPLDSPRWARDGLTDWNILSENESELMSVSPSFPLLLSMNQPSHAVVGFKDQAMMGSDGPLSPLEKEILESIFVLDQSSNKAESPVQKAEMPQIEEPAEDDDEEEDEDERPTKSLRRSKRVAAKPSPLYNHDERRIARRPRGARARRATVAT
ncbi:hypothetical protein SISNIDRAFT_480572 [Sistotremastrum niveocremeum HHB9708]|uniref:HTH APSES-type domain-containing protein n=1 Tax=Sistotremastrum niveocremeum HHB9708 TaxID=1314777 RepID=A0A165AH58_9AGAM|nr:hypothetical protein SISNIDRAFT_480572 [Sistotremastrum niveocremeum HHB9708]